MTDTALQHERERRETEKTAFGFWLYLMSDCLLFASLFATYAVLQGTGATGELFSLPFVLMETLLLLASSFTCGLMMLAVYRGHVVETTLWLLATFCLGAAFLWFEIGEFSHLVSSGHGPEKSGFLSAYFTLVGTHGLHIFAGLIWAFVLAITLWMRGVSHPLVRKFICFSLFWHFLDIVWIFIFSIVYLLGTL